MDAARMICELFGHRPRFVTLPEMPTGPLNRVADNSLAGQLLGWEPKVLLRQGVQKTIEWYVQHRRPEEVRQALESGSLIERKPK
jgi:nucleoside-diphosphate-sugar epimerase